MGLNETSHCTLGEECATCGSTVALEVAVLRFDEIGGMGCVTLCQNCIEGQRLPRLGMGGAVMAVWRPREHLGITADEMAVLSEAP